MKHMHPYQARNLTADKNDTFQTRRRHSLISLLTGATSAAVLEFPTRPTFSDRHGKRDLESGGIFEANGVRLLADELKPHSNLLQAGCTLIDFGPGNIDQELPSIDPALKAGWGQTPELGAVLSRCLMSQRRLSCRLTYSNQLARQAPDVAISFIESQLYSALAAELERAALLGSGSAGEPVGLLLEPSVETIDAVINEAAFARAEREIAEAYLDGGALGILMSPLIRSVLRNSAQLDDQFGPRLPRFCSPHLKDAGNQAGNVAIVGSFSELIVGTWGGISLQMNPYSRDVDGFSSYLAEMQVDVISLRPGSFRIINPTA